MLCLLLYQFFISAADVADLIVTLDDEKAWLNPYPEDLLGLSTPIFYPPDYSLECLSVGAGHSPNIDPLDYSFISLHVDCRIQSK